MRVWVVWVGVGLVYVRIIWMNYSGANVEAREDESECVRCVSHGIISIESH